MTSALDATPPLPVRKLHDPCRSLAEVRAEMRARLEDIGSREARLALHPMPDPEMQTQRLAELKRERLMVGSWLGVIDDEIATRAAAVPAPPQAHVAGLCDWSAGLSEGEP